MFMRTFSGSAAMRSGPRGFGYGPSSCGERDFSLDRERKCLRNPIEEAPRRTNLLTDLRVMPTETLRKVRHSVPMKESHVERV